MKNATTRTPLQRRFSVVNWLLTSLLIITAPFILALTSLVTIASFSMIFSRVKSVIDLSAAYAVLLPSPEWYRIVGSSVERERRWWKMRELDVLWASAIGERARKRKGKRRESRREKGETRQKFPSIIPGIYSLAPRTPKPRKAKIKAESLSQPNQSQHLQLTRCELRAKCQERTTQCNLLLYIPDL